MILKVKVNERTNEENIEFLKQVKPFYKLGPKCDKYNINKSNLYNLLNNKTQTVRSELLNLLVEDILDDLTNVVQDYVEIVTE